MGRELAKPRSVNETMSYVYEHGLRVMKPAYEPEEVREVLRAILVALSRVPIIEQFPKNSSVPVIGEKLGALGIKMVVGFTTGVGRGLISEVLGLAGEFVDVGSRGGARKAAKKAGGAEKTAKKAGKRTAAKKTAKRGSAAGSRPGR